MDIDLMTLAAVAVALAVGFMLGRMTTAKAGPEPDTQALAERYADFLADDLRADARITAIKRLRTEWPDLSLKQAKDVIDMVAVRRPIR